VYVSLYKYLGATGGAMLCGDKAVIGNMRHLIKVHGGAVYQNWINATMALHLNAAGIIVPLVLSCRYINGLLVSSVKTKPVASNRLF
jgi:hypothetical protein